MSGSRLPFLRRILSSAATGAIPVLWCDTALVRMGETNVKEEILPSAPRPPLPPCRLTDHKRERPGSESLKAKQGSTRT
nr:hypothetical protein CFP56_33537 [Quercus suber]